MRLTVDFFSRPVMLRMTAPFMQRSLGKIGSQSASPYTRRTPLSLPFLTKGRWHEVPEGISHPDLFV